MTPQTTNTQELLFNDGTQQPAFSPGRPPSGGSPTGIKDCRVASSETDRQQETLALSS
jgi:hypothetical protein